MHRAKRFASNKNKFLFDVVEFAIAQFKHTQTRTRTHTAHAVCCMLPFRTFFFISVSSCYCYLYALLSDVFFYLYLFESVSLSLSHLLFHVCVRSLRNLMVDTSSNFVCIRFELRFAYLLFPDFISLSFLLIH